MSSQTEKFLSAMIAAGENGVKTIDAQKLLGNKKPNAVHTAAHELKRKGHIFKNRKGTYFYKSGPKEDGKAANAVVPVQATLHENGPIHVMGLTVSQRVIRDMDPASRQDLIEQLRRARLHLSIAQAILDSHKMANELKEKL